MATCRQSPYLWPVPSATKAAIVIMTSFARRSQHATKPAILIMTSFAAEAGPCRQLPYLRPVLAATKQAVLIMMSFATELATSSATDVRTDTLPHLIYNDARCPGDPALAGYFLETGRVIGAESLNGQMLF